MHISRKTGGRRFAVSDIHGCLRTFNDLLTKINLTPEDTLFILGDYIDRGPDSKGVIDRIWELEKQGFNLHCLRGNHEQMMTVTQYFPDKASHWLRNGGQATLDSFPGGQIPTKYYRWVDELPYYFTTEGCILVHAGLNFAKDDPLSDHESMIWLRYWYEDIDHAWLDGRIIVHGHTPTERPTLERNLLRSDKVPAVNIDGGCVYDKKDLGWLIAFDMDKREYIFQESTEE